MQTQPPPHRPSRLLIVEDELDIRMILCEVLEQEGFYVEAARNGAEALQKLHAAGPRTDLILLDLGMPVMDGETFGRRWSQDPLIARIPVLVLSADFHARSKAAAFGATAFLAKPLDFNSLLVTIGELLVQAGPEQPAGQLLELAVEQLASGFGRLPAAHDAEAMALVA